MSRFLSLTIFFCIVIGAVLHFGVDIPYLTGWIGQLPGDMVIQKKGITIYAPLTSSALFSLIFSFLGSMLSGKS